MDDKLQIIQLILETENDSGVLNQVKALLMGLKINENKGFLLSQSQLQEVEEIRNQRIQNKWKWHSWEVVKENLTRKIMVWTLG